MSKAFWRGGHKLTVLDEASLDIGAGEFAAVQAPRRAGKTTLLSIAAGLIAPDAGVVRFDGADLATLPERDHTQFLRERLGWVRCSDEPQRGARMLGHVATPLLLQHGRREAERRAADALEQVGAERCARATWDRIRDVERALVTLARALVRQPVLLLVDDPTVGLDADERDRVVGLLRHQAETVGTGVLMAVSDKPAARAAHRVHTLHKGQLLAPADPSDGGARVIRFPVRR